MRYWFDTEFHDDGHTVELISIGVVSEDGREYYAVSKEYDRSKASKWLQENVLNQLGQTSQYSRSRIRDELRVFFTRLHAKKLIHSTPEFWAYCGEYDWVALRQLFGDLMAWPKEWPIFAMDIEQWRVQLGAPDFKTPGTGQHNALADARYARSCWLELAAFAAKQGRTIVEAGEE